MDLEKLLSPRFETASGMPEDDVDVPGVGTVRVRGLSRLEVLEIRDLPTAEHEQRMLSAALLDPVATVKEVQKWQRVAQAGEFRPVTDAILSLSGMGRDAARAAYRTFRDGPGSGVGAPSSGEAGDDGGAAASPDEQ